MAALPLDASTRSPEKPAGAESSVAFVVLAIALAKARPAPVDFHASVFRFSAKSSFFL
jgi:hypothetical protein